jgi:hypothetical protein
MAVVLPGFGLQFEILNAFGWYSRFAGFAIAVLGGILWTASNYVRRKNPDDEEPPPRERGQD